MNTTTRTFFICSCSHLTTDEAHFKAKRAGHELIDVVEAPGSLTSEDLWAIYIHASRFSEEWRKMDREMWHRMHVERTRGAQGPTRYQGQVKRHVTVTGLVLGSVVAVVVAGALWGILR